MIKKEIINFLKFSGSILEHTSVQEKLNEELIKQCWYPNTIVFRHKKHTHESIDDFMIRCLTGDYYQQIKTEYFYGSYPHRMKIYEEAFNLYEEERYLAAIPLFLSQIDGIISEFGLSGMFDGKNELIKNVKPKELKFFEYLNHHNQSRSGRSLISYHKNIIDYRCEFSISKGTTKISNPDEIGQLNRHGILHGNKKFLNYDSQINTLKVISLTLFIMNAIQKLKIEST